MPDMTLLIGCYRQIGRRAAGLLGDLLGLLSICNRSQWTGGVPSESTQACVAAWYIIGARAWAKGRLGLKLWWKAIDSDHMQGRPGWTEGNSTVGVGGQNQHQWIIDQSGLSGNQALDVESWEHRNDRASESCGMAVWGTIYGCSDTIHGYD